MKKSVLTVLTLFLITSISGLFLYFVNNLTGPIIQKNVEEKFELLVKDIFPNTDNMESINVNGNEFVLQETKCFNSENEVIGFLYKAEGVNRFGKITVLVGVINRTVVRVEFLNLNQSYRKIALNHTNQSYNNGSLTFEEVNKVNVVSGATRSTELIKMLVLECVKVHGEQNEK